MSSFAPTVLKFEAFPDRNLTVILFKDVTNAKDVLDKLLARTLEPEVALVNPRPIQSLFALRLAAHKALASRERNALTTRTLHSELVYNLSASKHITEGSQEVRHGRRVGRRVGVQVRRVRRRRGGRLLAMFPGAVPVNDVEDGMAALRDDALVKKYYKPGELECKEGIGSVEDAVVSRIGARDVL